MITLTQYLLTILLPASTAFVVLGWSVFVYEKGLGNG